MSTASTARQRTTVGVLVVVLITVLWFQLVWRGHQESSAGAVVDQAAAGLVTPDGGVVTADPAITDGAPLDDSGRGAPLDATATTVTAVPVDHVAELRVVHEAITAAGVRLVGYLPVGPTTAQVQLQAGYEGLVAFLAELRGTAPDAVIDALDAVPGEGTLEVSFTVRWAPA
jgi:hypothetical protein